METTGGLATVAADVGEFLHGGAVGRKDGEHAVGGTTKRRVVGACGCQAARLCPPGDVGTIAGVDRDAGDPVDASSTDEGRVGELGGTGLG